MALLFVSVVFSGPHFAWGEDKMAGKWEVTPVLVAPPGAPARNNRETSEGGRSSRQLRCKAEVATKFSR